MNVGVVGTGYVGLVTGTCLAEMGNQVICVDTDARKVSLLKDGQSPIYEPGLDGLLKKNINSGRLHFTQQIKDAVSTSEVLFIAVGTPSDKDGKADLKYVISVANEIGALIEDYKVVVVKSTVPVGTCQKVKAVITEQLQKRGVNVEFDVVSNPEFLKEGAAINDFMKPDRIVIGTETQKSKDLMFRLYEPFVKNEHPIVAIDITSSEMTKYAANAMLATKISFINEISRLCEKVGANVLDVRKGIGSDSRIGYSFIYAGLGYGGSCFPKDVKAIINTGKENGLPMSILESVEEVNQQQRVHFLNKILNYYNGDVKGKVFSIWGLAFKPGTDDMREAPSVDIINALIEKGAKVQAFDPVAEENTKELLDQPDQVTFFKDMYDCTKNTDALILCTEWTEFRSPKFELLKSQLADKVIFDGRNQYNPEHMKQMNMDYVSIGRDAVLN